jgi:hypothetical protein
VLGYERDFAGVVAEEAYTQESQAGSRSDTYGRLQRFGAKHRDLKSDLLLVRPQGGDQWLQFRDVFEVDGRAVRDRTDRLAKLFLTPSSSTSKQVSKITEESARYNIGTVIRNINVPMFALIVLQPENQDRFKFERMDKTDGPYGPDAWLVAFREVAAGTMIRGSGHQDLPAHGEFWIDPQTGRILATRLQADSRTVRATIDVRYTLDPKLNQWVPQDMTEEYTQPEGATITGHAVYSNFRRFQVKVDEKIAPIK